MKKLTTERKLIVESAIMTGKVGRTNIDRLKAQGLSFTNPEYRDALKVVWAAEKEIMDTLGCSMTRCTALLNGEATLATYYEADGSARKVSA